MRQRAAPELHSRRRTGDLGIAPSTARASRRWPSQPCVVALAAFSFPLHASAHGEAAILVFVAALAAAAGLVSGVLSGTWKQAEQVNWPQWFLAYLLLGCLMAGVAAGSFEGVSLFLAFGGIGGALPFLLAFYVSRPASSWLKHRVRRWAARSEG